ncbi:hypothetical protein FQN60_006089 [Etheostoma spectabile]|uniref:Uncharacterized protein n=1 Tax=Etheostoma spectabile TaxID=54343 RepID=A0A5J5CF29_9PERO|nr:hypothetical protein FQN60_006089 [Etheostoma spectabile]
MWTLRPFSLPCPPRASSSSKPGRRLRITSSATRAPRVETHRRWRPSSSKRPLWSKPPPPQKHNKSSCTINYKFDTKCVAFSFMLLDTWHTNV